MSTRNQGWRFERARKSADSRLLRKANVIGSAFGTKTPKNAAAAVRCYTVFVTDKKAAKELEEIDLVPETIIRNGVEWLTDVIPVGSFVEEAPVLTRDPAQELGTGDWVAQTANGTSCIVTCAHALGGIHRWDYGDHEEIKGSVNGEAFEVIGHSIAGLKAVGTGYGSSFGNFDAGLIGLTSQEIIDAVANLSQCRLFVPQDDDWSILENVPVIGYGSVSGPIHSIIKQTKARIDGTYIDFLVGDGESYLTRSGDSGLLWCTEDGILLGMHFAGERNAAHDNRSVRSAAMLAYRVADYFQLDSNRIVRNLF